MENKEMKSTKYILYITLTFCFMGLIGCSLFETSNSNDSNIDVTNGSFEQDGEASLSGWKFPNTTAKSHPEAAPNDGNWSLALRMGNVQTCPGGECELFLGKAYQKLPKIKDGDILKLSAWVKQPAGRRGVTCIYWTIFKADSAFNPPNFRYGGVDTTSSSEWVMLSVTDTLHFEESDSVGIILDAGLTSGPETQDDYSYFDLVSVEKIGQD